VKIWRKTGPFWEDVTNNLASMHGYNNFIHAIWIPPDDQGTVVVGTTNGAFISYDAGESWSATPLTGQVREFVYHPALDTLYAATKSGVHRSESRGRNWVAMNQGLRFLDVLHLEVDTKNGFLFAGINGASVWRMDLPPSSLWIGADEISAGTGGTVELFLNAGPGNAGRHYLMLGGITGTKPGIPLPGGLATLPLNWDPFSEIVFSLLNTSAFSSFLGELGASGKSTAQINAPPLPMAAVGVKMYFAFGLNNPFDFASNAQEVMILE